MRIQSKYKLFVPHVASTTPFAHFLLVRSFACCRKLARMKSFALLLGLVSLHSVQALNTYVHDSSFTPDYVLRVTLQNTTLNCESRQSTLVNETVPGPTLRIPEGKTTWIRVYNDMKDLNTTMHWHGLACGKVQSNVVCTLTDRQQTIHSALLRWIACCKSMADRSTPLLRLRGSSFARLCWNLLLPFTCRPPGEHRRWASNS